MNLRFYLVSVFLFLFSPSQGRTDETTRILFIGNRYTGQIRGTVTKLFEASPRGRTTELESIEVLSDSHRSTAKRCRAVFAPVGDTWAKVRSVNSDLGEQLYRKDGSNPSPKGAYLAACVFYATFFNESPREIPYRGGLPDAEASMTLEAVEAIRR